MSIDFHTLPENSRIWIYQAARSFTPQEIKAISKEIQAFLENWKAHGVSLKAAFEIKYKRFIIIGLDQSHQIATGCSIDSSVTFIKKLETKYKVNLLDKLNVSYKQGDYIAYKSLKDFIKMAKDKAVTKNTIVFNNLVNDIREYKTQWETPITNSWHSRFFK